MARGEVFVASTEFGTTRAITNTPQQERSVSFHKDGRTLLYTAERGDSWGLYETSIADESEPNFFAATKLKEEAVYQVATDSFQPIYSPDGKKIAFLSSSVFASVFTSVFLVFVDDASVCVLVFALVRTLVLALVFFTSGKKLR